MTHFELYLFTRLDIINVILGVIFIMSAFVFTVWYVVYFMAYLEDAERHHLPKWFNISIVFAGLLWMLVPTQKDIAIIYGGHFITNNQDAKEIPEEILKYINKELKELNND